MRRAILYLAGLAVAATAVFFTTYFLGRHSSLESELERLTFPRAVTDPGKVKGIPSLQPAEVPPEPPVATQDPGGEPLGEGILLTRSLLEPAGLVIVADLPAITLGPVAESPSIGGGLAAFLARPPAGLRVGLRALAGAAAECGSTDSLKEPGLWGGGELSAAFVAASGAGPGPRNPARAVEDAAEDLRDVPGGHSVVIIAGGEDGCNADLCGQAPPPGGPAQRIHVLLLAPSLRFNIDPGVPDAGTTGTPPPLFEPRWAESYRCLAERSGGTITAVSSPQECESELRRIAGELESAVVVRAYHYTGQEVKGDSPGGQVDWGATLRPARTAEPGSRILESERFPGVFAVPGGVYVVKTRFGGQDRTAAVAVGKGERAELSVTFATGKLFVQAFDAAGGEVVGDSTGFRCAWGADVFKGEDARELASTCSFPARFELAPGTYRVRARWKGVERAVDEVTVEAGASAVRTVLFTEEQE